MTKYWVQIDGRSDVPLTKEEVFSTYGNRLTGDTPCAKAGENKWGKLIDFFPDWQNPILEHTPIPPNIQQAEASPERYPILRLISTLYRIFAVFVGILAIVIVGIGIHFENWSIVLAGIFGGFFGVLTNLAIAEVIVLFLEIEKNTRKS